MAFHTIYTDHYPYLAVGTVHLADSQTYGVNKPYSVAVTCMFLSEQVIHFHSVAAGPAMQEEGTTNGKSVEPSKKSSSSIKLI